MRSIGSGSSQGSGSTFATGRALEQRSVAILSNLGWRARLVGGSGDQGADVIATRNGFTLLVQCKAYAKPVSNRAVQEAFAGQRYHAANAACVVSTAGYTPGAKALAASTAVLALDLRELDGIDRLLGLDRNRRIIRCRTCFQRMRVPVRRIGRVRCPRCKVRAWHWT
jgi:hypothetical protein